MYGDDRLRVAGEVSRGEKMLYSGTDPESNITEYTTVYKDDTAGGVGNYAEAFRGGLVFKAHRLCVSINSRLESNKEEEERREG